MNKELIFIHPTDTVFGMSAPYQSKFCYDKIYELKGRSENKPLGILLENIEQISFFSNIKLSEIEKVLPFVDLGITLILPRVDHLPRHLLTQSDSIGLRIPNHPCVKNLIKEYGPLMSTSANISGNNPVSTTDEARALFHDENIVFIEGKIPLDNIASTILKYENGKLLLIREGNVPKKSLNFIL